MTSLGDFLQRRYRELAAELGPALDQRAQLDLKIRRLREEIEQIQNASRAAGLDPVKQDLPLVAEPRKPPTLTIKDAVRLILKEYPQGLTALEILAKINERFDLKLVRTSLSPQLSRLKGEEEIENDGSVWRLLPEQVGPPK